MTALALLLAVAVGLGGIVGYLLTGNTWLLGLTGAGVLLASGGYVYLRGSHRRW